MRRMVLENQRERTVCGWKISCDIRLPVCVETAGKKREGRLFMRTDVFSGGAQLFVVPHGSCRHTGRMAFPFDLQRFSTSSTKTWVAGTSLSLEETDVKHMENGDTFFLLDSESKEYATLRCEESGGERRYYLTLDNTNGESLTAIDLQGAGECCVIRAVSIIIGSSQHRQTIHCNRQM